MFHLLSRFPRCALTAALTAALLVACGGGGGSSSSGSDATGTLRLALADAPSCGYDAVNVTVQKVRVHQSSSASDTDGGWSEVVLSPARRIDLLTLQNGVLAELGQVPLPTGKYTQMRLVLATNDGTNPLANSVVPSVGKTESALTTPSGQQSGVKMNVDIDIAANRMADFVLDFQVCKSIVSAGASGRYLLKPVVSVSPRYVSGVAGYVAANLASGTTLVSLQQGGVIIKATTPDGTGKFLLQPVAAGSYDLVVTAPGRATGVVTGVSVATDTVTQLTTSTSALVLPASASGTAAGAVTTGITPVEASVRVLQLVGAGPTVAIAGGPVDNATGAYSHLLPTNAPLVAPYVAPPAALVFAPATAAAGKYMLAATSGATTKATTVTVVAGAITSTPFSFP